MSIQEIKVPDLGGADEVEVIEVCVAVGESVEVEQSLIVVESDKASMEVPSPIAGTVVAIKVAEGDSVNEGSLILELETGADAPSAEPEPAAEAPAEPAPEPAAEPAAAPTGAAGSSIETVVVPDLGGGSDVECIEVCVAVGDSIDVEQSLVVLESDKASMEVPSPLAGVVTAISVSTGDTMNEGDALMQVEVTAAAAAPALAAAAPEPAAAPAPAPAPATASKGPVVEAIVVPDLGGASDVECIEVCVAVGDEVAEEQSLVVLESDKASMEVPSPKAGVVKSIAISVGATVNEGDPMLEMEVSGAAAPAPVAVAAPAAPAPSAPAPAAAKAPSAPAAAVSAEAPSPGAGVYAGPAVRMMARELGVDLNLVTGTGPRTRILKEDVQAFVKKQLTEKPKGEVVGGAGIPPIPEVDFSKFGPVRMEKMSKLHKVTAANMQRNWLNVPHVTQFDDADITEIEDFRKGIKAEAEKAGVKLTPLPFLLKACAKALKENPKFCSSLHADGEHIVFKDYIHIGVAVDTPAGLMVPVIRDVDQKSIYELAAETAEMGQKAKERKLKPVEMQGACFTISSLGGIGGTGFTPIVNAPEVGILGVSKLSIKPVWDGSNFVPRKMLPLALSYDHRAINGGDAGRFLTYLGQVLGDIRRIML